METQKNLLSSSPPFPARTLPISFTSPSSGNDAVIIGNGKGLPIQQTGNVHFLHEQTACAFASTPSTSCAVSTKKKRTMNFKHHYVAALDKKALSAAKQEALSAEDSELLGNSSLVSEKATFAVEGKRIVRSTRLRDRQSKKRKMRKDKSSFRRTSSRRKTRESFGPNDSLERFLSAPGARQFLSIERESKMISEIQDLMKLEEEKNKLESKFGRVPKLVEWAEAIGISPRALLSRLRCGNSSRERLIYSHYRLVVYAAKHYQHCGLDIEDLLQAGSMGLMKSVEKFNPEIGTRFGTYAYWWIWSGIRKAIVRDSRLIRLPHRVYDLLFKVMEAKRWCFLTGSHYPTKVEIAAHAGITVEKLEKLMLYSRKPLRMYKSLEEVIVDPDVEPLDVALAKKIMRQQVRDLLDILPPKEQKIVRLRYGFEDGRPETFSEMGAILRLSRERVRQLESRAMNKLKECAYSRKLDEYKHLLV